MRRIRSHLSYANVAATLALIIAIAGGTTAIAGSKAAKNSVASSSIKPFNVTARDLAGVKVVQANGQFASFAACSASCATTGWRRWRATWRQSGPVASWTERLVR